MWVRLDDDSPHHPKFRKAGIEAYALFVAGLCYCNKYLTNGIIEEDAVATLIPNLTERKARELASKLTSNSVRGKEPSWIQEGGHYRVHDFENYQPSREAVEAEREAARERMRRARRSLDVRQNFARSSDPVRPTPSRPVPSRPENKSERDLGAEFQIWFAAYPRHDGEVPAQHAWVACRQLPPLEEVLAALEAQKATGDADPNFWRKPAKYIDEFGWRDKPLPPKKHRHSADSRRLAGAHVAGREKKPNPFRDAED